jgi:hypothetical protein
MTDAGTTMSTRFLSPVTLLLVVAFGAIAFGILRDEDSEPPPEVPSSHMYPPGFNTLEEAIRRSDVIVIADLVRQTETKAGRPGERGLPTGDYSHYMDRTFRVVETLKGDRLDGQEIFVRVVKALEYGPPRSFITPFYDPSTEEGKRYVVFLEERFDESREREFLALAGDASLGLVVGDVAVFVYSEHHAESMKRYKTRMEYEGRDVSTVLSTPLSLERIRRTSTLPSEKLWPTPPPPFPTRAPPVVTPTVP